MRIEDGYPPNPYHSRCVFTYLFWGIQGLGVGGVKVSGFRVYALMRIEDGYPPNPYHSR